MSSSQDLASQMTHRVVNSPQRELNATSVLIVDDEPVFRRALRLHLEREGYAVIEASHLEDARRALGLLPPKLGAQSSQGSDDQRGPHPITILLCDWRLERDVQGQIQEESGLTLIEELKLKSDDASRPDAPDVLFMSAHASQQIALQAIELGAADFIMKPFETSELLFRVKRLIRERDRQRRLHEAETRLLGHEEQLEGLVGSSPRMRELFRLIKRVAPTQSKLLIQGESGTGKELVARAVHQLSQPLGQALSTSAPFVALNCASLPESLIESELFGHTQGAFTHAQSARRGLIEEADGGTLFLDEIGELPFHLQAKLLRVIQEGEVRRLGSNQTKQVNVRFVAATLKDLALEVEEGRFRADLYYRLNVITLQLPPLRDRLDDVPLLVNQLLTRLCARMKRQTPRLRPEVLDALKRHSWPGNVRELENALEHALILTEHDEEIKLESLPQVLRARASSHSDTELRSAAELVKLISLETEGESLSLKRFTRPLEEILIREALSRSNGVKTQAAKVLEISAKTLLYKIREYQIDFED